MKTLFTSILVLTALSVWSQNKSVDTKTSPTKANVVATTPTTTSPVETDKVRTGQTSVKVSASESAPLPYDVNDIYMGRKNEILNVITLNEIPADFPKYEKQWSVSDYNAVVDAYYANHIDILKEKYKQKINAIMNR